MSYMNLNRPLYPMPGGGCWDQRDWCDRCDRCDHRDCHDRESWRMPLFRCDGMNNSCDCGCSQTVRLENPCCPGECAEVNLSVDNCGNLVICVHRDQWKNDCRRPRKHC